MGPKNTICRPVNVDGRKEQEAGGCVMFLRGSPRNVKLGRRQGTRVKAIVKMIQ